MEDVDSSGANDGVGTLESHQIRAARERTAVAAACQAAAAAIDAFSRLPVEAGPSDKPAMERASLHLEMMLAVVRREACQSLADVRDKCAIYCQLEDVFPASDWRPQLFASDLVHDMADLLENPTIL